MFLLVFLSALVFVATVFVVVRARFDSRAEALLASTVLWSILVLAPIHALGLRNHLSAGPLALLVVAECVLVTAATFVGVDKKVHAEEVASLGARMLMLPVTAVAECVRARSFALVGVVGAGAVIAYTAWLSYLLPSSSWDGLWYHELTIGYALQNHGYAPIALPTNVPFPMNMIQQSNGFPRNCEMTNLWFVVFSGRDLVEVVNSFASIPLMLGTYLLARRFSRDRVGPMGWAAALFFIPAATMQLRSTYMDLHVAAFTMMALHFATKPKMRIIDGWFAMLSLSLLIGSKSMALASVPVLWLAAAGLVLFHNAQARRAQVFGVLGGGSLVVAAFGAVCYVRNWVLFQNPLWPMSFESKRLGIRWEGLAPIDAIVKQQGEIGLAASYTLITEFRAPGKDFADTGQWGYGDGVAFFLVPIGLVALGIFFVRFGGRLAWGVRSEDDALLDNLALVVAVLLGIAANAPKLWYPRYNYHLVAGLMILVGWLARRAKPFTEAMFAIVLASGMAFLYRATPGWGVTFREALSYAARSPAERDIDAPTDFTISPEVARARDEELTRDTVTVFAVDVYFPFVSQLWNEHYTNKLFWADAPTTQKFLETAERYGAKWVVAGEHGQVTRDLRSMRSDWQEIGLASRNERMVAFRKLR